MKIFIHIVFEICILCNSYQILLAQQNEQNNLFWCTSSREEQYKCLNFSASVDENKNLFNYKYMNVSCRQALSKEECMSLLDEETVDISSLDAGDVFIGGRYHSLLPIMQEIYEGTQQFYYAVAVIKKGSLLDVSSLYNLRSKKACFVGVGSLAGWVIPIKTLMVRGGLEIIDCNNHVKSVINYFGPSCAVNSLSDKYNPIGDNANKLCQICIGEIPGGRCTSSDPYSGFDGAFQCLVEAGDIAFLKHTTVLEMTKSQNFLSVSPNDFELLCLDGSRRPIQEYSQCNWAQIPSEALVVSSAKQFVIRKKYQDFLQRAVQIFATVNKTSRNEYVYNDNYNPNSENFRSNQNIRNNSSFKMFESSPFYGPKHNLLFQDSAVGLYSIEESRQTYRNYLGESMDAIYYIRQCTVNRMTLCVTSDPELEKCIKMKIALGSQLLKPEMECYKGRSHVHCMQAIKSGNADVAVFDAGDVYTAGLEYNEIPFMSEVYNLGIPEYYVVAVTKEEDSSTELTYLRGKYTCHTGIFTGAGWIIPLAYLISNGWIRSYGCDSAHAAAEYFGKSCVPGAVSPEYASGNAYDNLCHLCHGASYRYCRRDASEDYYGYTGAFRCLIEGGGDVAFLKHTTVYENTDGKRKEWWARDALNKDFQLLCPDGTRSSLDKYHKCNLGRVKANAIVTRGGEQYNETEINAYINLFIYALQFYSRKDDEEFSMFSSTPPYSDLIFQDATQQLRVIEPDKRYYDKYLGNDFMRARRIVDCYAKASVSSFSISLIFSCIFYLNFR